MVFNENETETSVEAFGTILYNNEHVLHCEKISLKELGTWLLPALYSLVFIIGFLGNTVVVVIFTKYRRLRIMTNIYLLNLAISDLLFLVTVTFWIHHPGRDDWVFGYHMCKLLSGFYYLALYREIFFIILLTIDRYLAIVHAVFALRAQTVTFAVITSAVTWGLAGLAAFPEFIFHESHHDYGESDCSPLYPEGEEDSWKRFHALRMNIFGLVLPLLIMVFCYSGIIKTLPRCPNKKKYKAIRLIFIIMVVFFIFWTPYNLVLLLSAFHTLVIDNNCEQSKHLDLAMQVTEVIAYTHCCVNPVIYAFVGERFQKHLQVFYHKHVVIYLRKCIPFHSSTKVERTNSASLQAREMEMLGTCSLGAKKLPTEDEPEEEANQPQPPRSRSVICTFYTTLKVSKTCAPRSLPEIKGWPHVSSRENCSFALVSEEFPML